MKHFYAFFLFVVFVLLPCIGSAHPSAALHRKDFLRVFDGFADDAAFREMSGVINKAIDQMDRELFPNGLGAQHRVLGHSWTLNGSIPRETLDWLKNHHPGKEKEIISVWRKISRNVTDDFVRITGLPRPQAKSLADIFWNIHLLGDLVPLDNTQIAHVLPPEEIVKNLRKDFEVLLKNHPQNAEKLSRAGKDLAKIVKANAKAGVQIEAEKIFENLCRLNLGEKLHTTWGKTLRLTYEPLPARGGVIANKPVEIVKSSPPAYPRVFERPAVPARSPNLKFVPAKSIKSVGKSMRVPVTRVAVVGSGSGVGARTFATRIPIIGIGIVVAVSYGQYALGMSTLQEANRDMVAGTVGFTAGSLVGSIGGAVGGSVGAIVSTAGVAVVAIAATGAVYYCYHHYDTKKEEERITKLFKKYDNREIIEKLIRYEEQCN